MKNIMEMQRMLKAAKEMQDRLQKELAEMRIEGSSGGGMVTVVMDGRKSPVSVRIDREVVDKDDIDMLQDLVLAALSDAAAKVDARMEERLGALGANLKIPGMF
ncbi:MAG TPA: YbaB/EbfC family nucleoid-associated protein [Acidobacteriota bacterium]|nr:YbaB/EbfC family nucleoid-associated protein [Acidobacteriota bacterium]